jgi:hypothetical protein
LRQLKLNNNILTKSQKLFENFFESIDRMIGLEETIDDFFEKIKKFKNAVYLASKQQEVKHFKYTGRSRR